MSLYLVTGASAYREHEPGERFEATLDAATEQRAIARRHIRVLKATRVGLEPGSYRLPAGISTHEGVNDG